MSERVTTSELFEENKEVKQELSAVATKPDSLQSDLIESKKTNLHLKQELEEYEMAKQKFHEPMKKKTNQMEKQSKIGKLVKWLQVINVENDIQRAEAIHLIEAVNGK